MVSPGRKWTWNLGRIWKRIIELSVQSYLSLVTETGSRFAGSKSELISGASSSAVKFCRLISSVFCFFCNSFFFGWHTGGKSIFLADAITDPADFMVAPLIGNILVMINKRIMQEMFTRNFQKYKAGRQSWLCRPSQKTMDHVNTGGHNVILTPGRYNAAYFEHSYLAEKTGAHEICEKPMQEIIKRFYEHEARTSLM